VGGDGVWKYLHDDARMVEVVENVAEQVAHLEAVCRKKERSTSND
jgi:hypothetical protein